jgi:Protein of unknown function, DUF481
MKMTIAISFISIFLLLSALPAVAQTEEPHDFQEFSGEEPEKYPKWSASGSIGYNSSGGYIETQAVAGDLQLAHERQWTGHLVKSGINYGNVTYPEGDPINNVSNYFGNYKIEAYVYKDRKPYFWSLLGAESDEFQGFWGRYIAEAGFGYSFFGMKDYVVKSEVGYAFVDTNWINKVELENGEFHLWEPTHNGLARQIIAVPILSFVNFTEEATYRHNFQDEDDYVVDSATGLSFRLTSKLSFKTTFDISYTNQPGPIEELDETGAAIMIDDDGDPNTDDVASLIPADRTAYGWTNAIVISFF